MRIISEGKKWKRLAAVVALAIACTGLFGVPEASAATGDLSYLECIRYSGIDRNGCAQIKPGLEGVKDVVVSPDGRFVYALGEHLTTFARDPVTGALTWLRCHATSTKEGCTGLWGWGGAVSDIAITADGKNLYVAQYVWDRVTTYSRNVETGDLILVGCIEDSVDASGDCDTAPGMDSPNALALVDAGDRNLYVVNQLSFSITWFRRSITNGALSFQGCMSESSRPRIGNCYAVPGLAIPVTIEARPDGGAVYVGTYNTILGLTRSGTDGTLTYGECYGTQVSSSDTGAAAPSNCDPRPGIYGVIDLEFTDDGKGLYAVSQLGDAVVMLLAGATKVADTAYYSCWRDVRLAANGCNPAIYIASPGRLDISPDGRTVYVTGTESHSVTPFNRNLNLGGRLEQRGCFLDLETTGDGCTSRVQGLGNAFGVAVSPDNNTVYVAGGADQALVRFRREHVSASGPPPSTDLDTTITASNVSGRTATFSFSSNEANVTYVCSLDDKPFRRCASPKQYSDLKKGRHRFRVAAVDAAKHRDSTPASVRFRIS